MQSDSTYGLASKLPPPAGQQLVSMSGLDVSRVLNRSPWELGEGPTRLIGSLHLHFEAGFLRHRSVEATTSVSRRSNSAKENVHIVSGQESAIQEDVGRS
jgi:hypothetical protein